MFFKGYVETKGKQCIEKFKNRTKFKTYEQVQSLTSFAGILAEETILVDVDDMEQSEILFRIIQDKEIRCRVYKTTHGMHFLFHNPKMVDKCYTKTKTACGLVVDIKVGCKNSYSVLKFEGVERPIIYDTAENAEAEDLPLWLLPVRHTYEFLHMGEGTGRNSAVYSYILTLQKYIPDIEDCREVLQVINDYIFDVPMSQEELEVAFRDEAFQQESFYDKDHKFIFNDFANFLRVRHHIIRINGQLHLYEDGIYTSGQREIESVMIDHIPMLSRAKRSEVSEYLDILVRKNTPAAPARYIAFRNGIYDLESDSFIDFSPEIVITNKIPWDYNPSATSTAIDTMLNNVSCHDAEIRSLLEEVVGACMYRSNTLAGGKAIILTGSGSNGKSTFLKTLGNVLGEENTTSLDMKKLDDRFSTVMMFGKLANIGDDISNEFIADTSIFKKIVTGETIDAEQKGQPKFEFKPYCKLLFSANNIPRMGKGSDNIALMRRLVIVPFNANFSKNDADYNPNIEYDLAGQESMEYLIQLGIKGLKRVIESKSYTASAKVKKELEEYEERNNPILLFFRECDDEDYDFDGKPTSEVYTKYVEFCITESLQQLSKIEFSRQIAKQCHLKTVAKRISGKLYRVFVEDEGD